MATHLLENNGTNVILVNINAIMAGIGTILLGKCIQEMNIMNKCNYVCGILAGGILLILQQYGTITWG